MVEAHEEEQYDMENDKSFIEEPAILDKYKAAAVIADGKSFFSQAPTPVLPQTD